MFRIAVATPLLPTLSDVAEASPGLILRARARQALQVLFMTLAFSAGANLSPALAQTTPGPATAPGSAARSHELAAHFATVLHTSGDVRATRNDNERGRALHEGDAVFVGEHLRTGAGAELLLKTDDAGMIGERANSDFLAEHFAATGAGSDNMALRLARGSLRIITGWIGRLSPRNYHVTTPTATIGIRGTDHEPFVLSAEAASGTPYKAGSYDKVNRGATFISVGEHELDVAAGQVGVAPDAPGIRTRGIMTLALPFLLDHVPEFYRGGKFEDEMDAYSATADSASLERHKAVAGEAQAVPAACDAVAIGRDWVGSFDQALERRDAPAIIAQFAPEATVEVTVHDASGKRSTNTLSRQELAQSASAATAGLTDYKQTRETLDAARMPGQSPADCQRVYVDSLVTEQGRMNGSPYRIQSREEYLLEARDGRWLAVHAVSTQR